MLYGIVSQVQGRRSVFNVPGTSCSRSGGVCRPVPQGTSQENQQGTHSTCVASEFLFNYLIHLAGAFRKLQMMSDDV